MLYTSALRDRLIAAYERERENWGDADADHFIAHARAVPAGTELPSSAPAGVD